MGLLVPDEPARRRSDGRWDLVLLGALTLFGALLRAWQIGTKPLWIDEAFSVWVARQPLAEGARWLVRIDQHPPLYYALLHVWLHLGAGPAMVRLLSALASTANIPVLYALGARLTGRRAGLLAAAVLALSPFHVYLAQEARMYALLSLVVTGSLWALAWLHSEAGRGRDPACVGAAHAMRGVCDELPVRGEPNGLRSAAGKEGMAPESAAEIASPGRPPLPSGLAMTGKELRAGRRQCASRPAGVQQHVGAARALAGICDEPARQPDPRGSPRKPDRVQPKSGDGAGEGGVVSGSAVGIAWTKRPWPRRKERLSWLAMTGPGGLGAQGATLGVAPDDLTSVTGVTAWAMRRWVWAVYVVATAAALWTHNTAVLYWGAANAIVLGLWAIERRRGGGHAQMRLPRDRPDVAMGAGPPGRQQAGGASVLLPPPLGSWALAQGAVLLLWAPWLPGFTRQSAAVYERFWLASPTWRTVLRTAGDFLCAFLPQRIGWTPLVWAGYGALLALGLWALWRRRGRLWFLLVAFLAPVGGAWLISTMRPIFYDRTLIWATMPLYVVLSAGIARLRYRSFAGAAMAMVATLSLLSARDYYVGFQKEAWDEAAAYVAGQATEGDLVLFHATWTQLPFDYYFRAYGLPVEERGVPVDLFARGVLEPQMTADDAPALRKLVDGRRRVWLVYSHQWYTDPEGRVPRALGEALVLQGRRRFYGLEVRLYGQRGR